MDRSQGRRRKASRAPASRQVDWYRDIYSRPVYLRLYEPVDRPNAPAEARAAARLLNLRPGERVLDVACGFGRHVAELDRLGFITTGLDLSELLLARAGSYASEHRLPARYVRADIRALPFRRSFDAAVNFFLSFGYLSDDENQATLTEIATALRPGGRFLLDTWNAAQVIAALQPRVVEEREDVTVVEKSRYVAATRRIEWHDEARFRDGSREKWSQSIRAYLPAEWSEILGRAGFTGIEMFGDWDGSAFNDKSPRLILLAGLSRE